MTIFQRVNLGKLPKQMTVADVYRLHADGLIDERERFELIEGEIVPMAAAKVSPHERMKSRLNEYLVTHKPRDVGMFVESSVALSERTLVEPDLALWPKTIESQDVRGPDLLLVVEVASSSIGYDLKVKAALYVSHGVRDYWVVDALRRTVRTHRDRGSDGYATVEEFEEDEPFAALLLPDVRLRLADLD